ncbi:MAG TPA: MAPEG family protein [Sphingomicrobium sp.]|nr:MAPEG family protein [Sphingomicrobium sp.]
MVEPVTPAQRRKTMGGIAVSAIVAALLWYALLRFLPAPAGAEPFTTALACSAIAGLLTLVLGVEAIAHERLFTAAIDPLAGVETPRMRVNFRYLSNTVEQFIVFAAGLLALSAYASARLLVIVTIVWVLARWAFWIGYHRSPLLRGLGAPGMMQSMIVLLYIAYRWTGDAYGQAAGIALIAIFLAIEAYLFWAVKRPSQ